LFDEKFPPKISTQQKNLCYYAALIWLSKFFLSLAARTVSWALSAVDY